MTDEMIKREDALLPCPFCKCEEVTTWFDREQGEKWGYASCDGCAARGPEVRTNWDREPDAPWHSEAIAAWNTRALPATDPAPAKQVTLSEAEAIREAALREVLALRRLGQTCFDNIEVMKDGWLIHEDDVKALIGEKK